MKISFMRLMNWLAKKISNKYLKLITDLVILSASSYLMVKKVLGVSISGWLLANAFQQPLVNFYIYFSGLLLLIAIIMKLIITYFDYFPPLNHHFVEPDEISNCLYRMNSEIGLHIDEFSKNNELTELKTICEQHGYKVNLALIIDSLAEHIRKSIKNIKIKKKDLFISLYKYDDNNSSLEYILHYDSKRDLVESRTIKLDSEQYSEYESVKCVNSTNTTAYVLHGKREYARGASKRHKSIQHYLGCKIASENQLYGFLNIEFHHSPLFADEEAMQDFMEEHIYPFKLLLDYQFLKKELFNSFKDVETNWRVA